MFIRFDTTHERDRQRDTHTDRQTPHDDIGRLYASRRAVKRNILQYSNSMRSATATRDAILKSRCQSLGHHSPGLIKLRHEMI